MVNIAKQRFPLANHATESFEQNIYFDGWIIFLLISSALTIWAARYEVKKKNDSFVTAYVAFNKDAQIRWAVWYAHQYWIM